jgi:protein ImuA
MAQLDHPPENAAPPDRAAVLESLTERMRQIEGARWSPGCDEVISSGHAALDGLLPAGGFRRGTLVEWLALRPASGAGMLALLAARQALEAGGVLVVIDRGRRFYPPAAIGLGIALEQLIVVRPGSAADEAWALDQVLRWRGVAAAWCAVERADDHTLRRWQLAVESSGTLGFLLRGEEARGEPSWAELRLGIQPLARPASQRSRARRLRVELLRARTGPTGQAIELEIPEPNLGRGWHSWRGKQDEAGSLHLAPSVAAATTGRRSRRA